MVYCVDVEVRSIHLVTQLESTKLEEDVQVEEDQVAPVVELTPLIKMLVMSCWNIMQ